jgi:hypothetical protein
MASYRVGLRLPPSVRTMRPTYALPLPDRAPVSQTSCEPNSFNPLRHSLLLTRRIRTALVAALAWAAQASTLTAGDAGFKVAVTSQEIQFHWNSSVSGPISISILPLATNQTTTDPTEVPGRDEIEIWRGNASRRESAIPRFDGLHDRLFAKYRLSALSGRGDSSTPQYVTDFSALRRPAHSLGSHTSKKGITCLLDVADGLELGCAQLNENIDIQELLDLQSAEPRAHFLYEGRAIGLKPAAVTLLDTHLKTAFNNGQRVTGILLNNVRPKTPASSPLVHPLTHPEQVPIGPSAFNTATEEGIFYYRAILHWLVERYTRGDAAFGFLSGLVIGNEMQSHWSWYHLGAVDPQIVIREYATALRVADLVTRSLHQKFQVYISLEHHWSISSSAEPTKGFPGIEALKGIHRISEDGGNFPWCIAFHPYPENLFKPEFWKDRSAPLRFDAPRITFHNIEVLPAFLKQPEYLFEGRARAIALTEQGFHCPEGADGEQLQAAAFALAWKKVQSIPEIESFLYHRHVDHPHEWNLHCGIRAHDGSKNVNGVGKKRALWKVFKSAGTEEEDAAFAFALPILGRSDWNHLTTSSFSPPRQRPPENGRVVFDFVTQRHLAVQENLQNVALKLVGPEDEAQSTGLLEHPKPKGRGRLSYNVRIPSENEGDCILAFDALLNHEKSAGAVFQVEIEGREVFSQRLTAGQRVPVEVLVNAWRGSEVSICWIVDALEDPAYDWTTWVAPRLLLRKPTAPKTDPKGANALH